ncbi:hypothetical protein [Deinococcus sp. Leaf326]|uniref:hypothetical protein n=1 Tax=Deinococcus sp. Leaf326 TaxID=1736338 RepID=UPI00070201A2|nr:hypothetical protein [Deinococcus sp. Leaf326]KQR33136.1 hypothetical protein ASF71_16735 [Deinococcus sp. Leaf326]
MNDFRLEASVRFDAHERASTNATFSEADLTTLQLAYASGREITARTNLGPGYAYIGLQNAQAIFPPDGRCRHTFTLVYNGEIEAV